MQESNKRQVTEENQNWFDQHVLTYSDDYRFVGYESKLKNVLDRSLDASESLRGKHLSEVGQSLEKQYAILDRKKTALVNIVSQNDDKVYHIDNEVVSSFIGKMVDDYAVADNILHEAESMDRRLFNHYYEEGDPALMHTVLSFADDNPGFANFAYSESYDTTTEEELIERIHENQPNIIGFGPYASDEFAYVDGDGDVFMSGQAQQVLHRGEVVGEIGTFLEPNDDGELERTEGKDSHDEKSFTSLNSTHESTVGIYKIEDGDVFRYTEDESKVQKLTGKGSVKETEAHTERASRLQQARNNRFNEIIETLDTETGRLYNYDFATVQTSLEERLVIPEPGFKPVVNEQAKETEDELEL